jgi:lipoprotein-anchoring transpeptidase ErfK/SrfK
MFHMRISLAAVPALALVACGAKTPATVAEVAPVAALAPTIAIGEPNPSTPAIVPPAAVPALIAGTWVSIDDAKSSITLTADGNWTDSYSDGTKDETYPWRVISGVEAKAASPTNEFTPEATYLEVKRTEATYYYELGGVDAENLDMFYVGRGNRLAYTRAK